MRDNIEILWKSWGPEGAKDLPSITQILGMCVWFWVDTASWRWHIMIIWGQPILPCGFRAMRSSFFFQLRCMPGVAVGKGGPWGGRMSPLEKPAWEWSHYSGSIGRGVWGEWRDPSLGVFEPPVSCAWLQCHLRSFHYASWSSPFYLKPVGAGFSVTCNQESWIWQASLLCKKANSIQHVWFYLGKRKGF